MTTELQEAEIRAMFAHDQILQDGELSEQGKLRIAALFDTAVNARASSIVSELGKPINVLDAVAFEGEGLSERSQAEIERLFTRSVILKIAEQLEDAAMVVCEEELDRIERGSLNENSATIVNALRIEKIEKLENDLLDLFLEHFCVVPNNRINVARQLREENEHLRAQVAEATAATQAITEAEVAISKKEIFEVIRIERQMTLMDKGRLESLCEGVEFVDGPTFKTKVTQVYEQHFQKRNTVRADVISETFDGETSSKRQQFETPLIAEASRMLG